jgi:hypothetical protein
VSHTIFFQKRGVCGGFLERGEILPLQILNQRLGQQMLVIEAANSSRLA